MNNVDHIFGPELRKKIREHLKEFHSKRIQLDGKRHAAVAAVLLEDEEGRACFLLTRRSESLRRHRGQWALPGGGVENEETADEAALRELEEEVDLRLDKNEILGHLDDYSTRSGFVITPVVLWCCKFAALTPDPNEVAAAYRVPLTELYVPESPRFRKIPESDRPVISLPLMDTQIHAPTAAILYQFREVALRGRQTRVAHYEQPVFAWE